MTETLLNPTQKRKPLSFFVDIGIIGLLAVLIGFGKTFIIPTLNGEIKTLSIVRLHGAFAYSWIVLFLH